MVCNIVEIRQRGSGENAPQEHFATNSPNTEVFVRFSPCFAPFFSKYPVFFNFQTSPKMRKFGE
jgi:hypothetical protein